MPCRRSPNPTVNGHIITADIAATAKLGAGLRFVIRCTHREARLGQWQSQCLFVTAPHQIDDSHACERSSVDNASANPIYLRRNTSRPRNARHFDVPCRASCVIDAKSQLPSHGSFRPRRSKPPICINARQLFQDNDVDCDGAE